MSDIDAVTSKVKQLVDGTRVNELMAYGALSFEDFRQMMDNVCQGRLTDQELITLARSSSSLSSSQLFVVRLLHNKRRCIT